ncbi:MAG: hypothetical protein ACFFCZ_13880 [Promethearchaeota archaeon]
MKKDIAILAAGGIVVIATLGTFAVIDPFITIPDVLNPEDSIIIDFPDPNIYYDDLDFNAQADLITFTVRNLKQNLIYTDSLVVEYENSTQVTWIVPSTALLPDHNTTIRAYAPSDQQLIGGGNVTLTMYFYRFIDKWRENLNASAVVSVQKIQYYNFDLNVKEISDYSRDHVAVVQGSEILSRENRKFPKNSIRVFDSEDNQVSSTVLSSNRSAYLCEADEIIFGVSISAGASQNFRLQASPNIGSAESLMELACVKTTALSSFPIYSIKRQYPNDHGFFRDWLTLGPFPNDRSTHNGTFEDYIALYSNQSENTITPIEGYGDYYGYDGQLITWNYHSSSESRIYLGENWYPDDWIVGYAFTYIFSPIDVEVELRVGSDDGISIFNNNERIYQYSVYRSCQADDDIIYTSLKKGFNPILVKLDQGWGDYCFMLRFNLGDNNDQGPLFSIIPLWQDSIWSGNPLQVSFF